MSYFPSHCEELVLHLLSLIFFNDCLVCVAQTVCSFIPSRLYKRRLLCGTDFTIGMQYLRIKITQYNTAETTYDLISLIIPKKA